MQIDIFDVEHGSCALVTTDNNKRILIDAGHNSTTGWRPSSYLPSIGVTHLDQLIITNYDEDHASDLHNLLGKVSVGVLGRNRGVEAAELKMLKGVDAGPGIAALIEMMGTYTGSVSADDLDYAGATFTHFRHEYPVFTDENNLSLVTILRHYNLGICFPGDMEEAGWNALIDSNPDLLRAMGEVNIFVASHHGRENGCCARLYQNNWKPEITLISDSGIEHATQETVAWYRARSNGMTYGGQNRHVFTTRTDGGMRIVATAAQTLFDAGVDHSVKKKPAWI